MPVPAPFDSLLGIYLNTRPNLLTATNPGSQLLFPGRRASQPMHPATLRLRLAAAGIPNITGRIAAVRDLLLEAPTPVVAGLLGYSRNTPNTSPRQQEARGRTTRPQTIADDQRPPRHHHRAALIDLGGLTSAFTKHVPGQQGRCRATAAAARSLPERQRPRRR